MSNLREIKQRIKTIENIEHVTDAIQKISAIRLIKAKNRVSNYRIYKSANEELLGRIYNNEITHPLLKENPGKPSVVIITASDKGLCGPYNTGIIELAADFIRKTTGDNTQLILCGKKVINHFEKMNYSILKEKINLPVFVSFKDIEEINNLVIDLKLKGEINTIHFVYTEFTSISKQTPVVKKIIPLELPEKENITSNFYLLEPDIGTIMEYMLPNYVKIQILNGFIEAAVSEHAARMMMMDRATHSSKDMISDLTSLRNKNRQSMITKELSEIVGTTNALDSE